MSFCVLVSWIFKSGFLYHNYPNFLFYACSVCSCSLFVTICCLCFCHVCVFVLPLPHFPQSLFCLAISITHFSCPHLSSTVLSHQSPSIVFSPPVCLQHLSARHRHTSCYSVYSSSCSSCPVTCPVCSSFFLFDQFCCLDFRLSRVFCYSFGINPVLPLVCIFGPLSPPPRLHLWHFSLYLGHLVCLWFICHYFPWYPLLIAKSSPLLPFLFLFFTCSFPPFSFHAL